MAAGASAAEPQVELGIKPVGVEGSYFALTMAPGETRELTVELSNHGDSTVRIQTYPADAYSLVNGGFGARLAGEPISGTTRWLDYPADSFDLEPGAAIQRTFTVAVPADAKPGEYLTSLAIQNADPVAVGTGGNIAFNQVMRQVIAVSIDIPGPRTPALAISGVVHKEVAGRSTVVFGIENTGNVRLTPSGEFVLRTPDGAEVSRAPVTLGAIYAGTATDVEVPLAERLNAGDYIASLSLSDSATGATAAVDALAFTVPEPAAASGSAAEGSSQGAAVNQPAASSRAEPWATWAAQPWALIGAGTGAVLLALIVGLVVGRRARRPRPGEPPAREQRGSVPPSAHPKRPHPVRANAQPAIRQLRPPGRRSEGRLSSGD